MSLRDRLRARQLPTETVILPAAVDGGELERIELRALPAVEWEALVQLHPPTDGQRAEGAAWNYIPFRAALLAASVVTPEGEEPLTEQDWQDLIGSGSMTSGEITVLFNAAVTLNNRAPAAGLGKGSGRKPS